MANSVVDVMHNNFLASGNVCSIIIGKKQKEMCALLQWGSNSIADWWVKEMGQQPSKDNKISRDGSVKYTDRERFGKFGKRGKSGRSWAVLKSVLSRKLKIYI